MSRGSRAGLAIALSGVLLGACQSLPPIETASANLDLERFMGDWYVIAAIPTFFEREAYNPKESYRLDDDGRVLTTFTFNKGSYDGPLKTYTPVGFVSDESNSVWGMRFVWPFRAEYRILYVDGDYSVTIIGRRKRDYVWIMARSRELDAERYDELVAFVAGQGYDVGELRRMPHGAPDGS